MLSIPWSQQQVLLCRSELLMLEVTREVFLLTGETLS